MADNDTPILVFPPVVEPVKPEEPVKAVEEVKEEPKIEELEYEKILREYGGLESNVPVNSPYWRIRP